MSFGTADIWPLISLMIVTAIFVGIVLWILRPRVMGWVWWVVLGVGLVIIVGWLVSCGRTLWAIMR